ncbi:uncharacterized protein B0H18DRAFT_1014728 [Fomitopsis serialis]|uniref:uncharacterized protein n=1 Tax=Fomitopsis serialis TaxID=139415 RepID=UPI002007F49E|nr:uncharacterized protein B0H18DRAFT_1014728 [Neoantrodia serialis]KAH9923482.1 hypothetical protein B0H18DRAFT_1014728 [Neoantrodia serialis]
MDVDDDDDCDDDADGEPDAPDAHAWRPIQGRPRAEPAGDEEAGDEDVEDEAGRDEDAVNGPRVDVFVVLARRPDGQRPYEVIHLDTILRAGHLPPVYGDQFIPARLEVRGYTGCLLCFLCQ